MAETTSLLQGRTRVEDVYEGADAIRRFGFAEPSMRTVCRADDEGC